MTHEECLYGSYDIFQNFRIKDTQRSASDASFKADTNQIDLKTLQDQVDHLSLVCEAMCELMAEIGFNKSMLAEKIKEIDLRDGRLDGKMAIQKICPKCSRESARRHVKCLYCGTPL